MVREGIPPPALRRFGGLSDRLRSLGADRHSALLLLLSLTVVVFTLVTFLGQYSFFQRLDVRVNHRLLNSARAWADYGFWKLGGFLNFQYDYAGNANPQGLFLYRSHVPIYALLHYLAFSLNGEQGYWLVVGWIPVMAAFAVSLSLAVIAYHSSVRDGAGSFRPSSWCVAPIIPATIAFAIAFPSEPIWSLAWNIFDGSLSLVLLLVGIAVCVSSRRRHAWEAIGVGFILLSAFVCARFGILLALVMAAVKFLSAAAESRVHDQATERAPFRWTIILAAFLLASSHFAHIWIGQKVLGISLGGQKILYRLGLTHLFREEGQNRIDYHTPLSTFTFLWRQSEAAIGALPPWMNSYHFLVWTLAIVCFTVIVSRVRDFPGKPFWDVLLLLPLAWCVLFNQSAAEHPDLVGILWLPAFVLGLSSGCTALYARLASRWRRAAAVWWTGGLLYLLFLWQIQYFLRAYPQMRGS